MGKKILVVDDEPQLVRIVQFNLERAGYEVRTAFDGLEALERVEEEVPDLIILDVMMPRLDGFETLRRLRENPHTREIPVMMLTAKAQDVDVLRAWQQGADCHLAKPFNPQELLSLVRRLVGKEDPP